MQDYDNSSNMTENLKKIAYVKFEPEIIEEWIDPYDSIPLKFLTLFVYLIEIISAIIMLVFVAYETGGYAGHYRTFINQLLSYLYGGVRQGLLKIWTEHSH